MNNGNQTLFNILMIAFFTFLIITAIAAIILFFALILKRRVKKGVTLFALSTPQELANNEANYFSFIKYDAKSNAIVLKKAQEFKKCVVTLIYRANGKEEITRYNLDYSNAEKGMVGISLANPIDEYLIVLESVDGSIVKHASYDNYFTFHLIYGIVVSVLFAVSIIFYVLMCRFYLRSDWPAYNGFYALSLIGLSFLALVLLGHIIGETLAKKGAF